MLIPSRTLSRSRTYSSLSRRVNANSQRVMYCHPSNVKLIKKGEC